MNLKGTGASSGIGIGKIVIIKEIDLDYSKVKPSDIQTEKARLKAAIKSFCENTQKMAEKVKIQVGEKEAQILAGHIMMIKDPFMTSQMNEAIENGSLAEAALDEVCSTFINMFENMDDELMSQRASDIKDIRTRILKILLNVEDIDISSVPPNTVLAAKDFTPSMTVGIKKENVAAILTETGGKTSHSAILSRALEIPAVLGIENLLSNINSGELVIVDGQFGEVFVSPDNVLIEEYELKQQEYQKNKQLLKNYLNKPTISSDGIKYSLYANIGNSKDAEKSLLVSAEGIGLFRTEFLFMDKNSLPTEQEQYEVYREVSDVMKGKEVIIRTLDVGGDKEIPYLNIEKEENPFLGHRAIRYCLDRKDIFAIQLRALLRAGAENKNIKIMLPLISSIDEVREAKLLIRKIKSEFSKENISFHEKIKLGVMIETPAAALIADLLAKEVDFFSIGTNDLTQYTVAVDRGNPNVEKLYSTFNPAVLRSIRNIIKAAKSESIPVGMCGESAADPCLIPLLLAFGLDEFSVSPSSILSTRKVISNWSTAQASDITEKVMMMSCSQEIESYLKTIEKK